MHEPRYARLVPNRASDPQIVERLKVRVRDARVQLAAAIADGRGDDAWAAALVASIHIIESRAATILTQLSGKAYGTDEPAIADGTNQLSPSEIVGGN